MTRIWTWLKHRRANRRAPPDWRRGLKVWLLGVALIALGGSGATTGYAQQPHKVTAKSDAKSRPAGSVGKGGVGRASVGKGSVGKSGAGAASSRQGTVGGPVKQGPGVMGIGIKPQKGTAKTAAVPAPKTGLGGAALHQHGTLGGPVKTGPGITGTAIKPKKH